jgi:hypothetical protein
MSVIFRATARWEDAWQFFEALGDPLRLLKELAELIDGNAIIELKRVIGFSGENVDLSQEAATIVELVLVLEAESGQADDESGQTGDEFDTLA